MIKLCRFLSLATVSLLLLCLQVSAASGADAGPDEAGVPSRHSKHGARRKRHREHPPDAGAATPTSSAATSSAATPDPPPAEAAPVVTDPPRGELRPDPAPTDAEPPPAAVLDPSLSSSAPPASPTAEPEASAPLFGGPSTSSGRRARRGGASARGGSFEHGGGWWPLALGVPLITAGGLMAGFGISALVINGQCVGSGACDRAYDTKLAGGLLLGLGLPLAAGGAVVIALRPRLSGSRHAVLQRVAAAPVAGGLR